MCLILAPIFKDLFTRASYIQVVLIARFRKVTYPESVVVVVYLKKTQNQDYIEKQQPEKPHLPAITSSTWSSATITNQNFPHNRSSFINPVQSSACGVRESASRFTRNIITQCPYRPSQRSATAPCPVPGPSSFSCVHPYYRVCITLRLRSTKDEGRRDLNQHRTGPCVEEELPSCPSFWYIFVL